VSVRCFVAIELPDEVHTLFSGIADAVRIADATWRGEKWVARDNLHITLKFVGHIAEDSVDALVAACRRETEGLPGFEILPDSIRAVPSATRARMLWGSFTDPSGRCAELAAAAERAALHVGAEPETRAFKPHVTLVRARSPHRIAPQALDEGNLLVQRFDRPVSVRAATVFRSTLSRSGPTYTALAICPLAG
jgi:RNA 2',3'-cyclic 3'-phosphodiesterase